MMKQCIMLSALSFGFASAMDAPLDVKKYFDTIKYFNLSSEIDYRFEDLAKDKNFWAALPKMIEYGEQQIQEEKQNRCSDSCRDIMYVTASGLTFVGISMAFGWMTGDFESCVFSALPIGFVIGQAVSRCDSRRIELQTIKKKLNLLRMAEQKIKLPRSEWRHDTIGEHIALLEHHYPELKQRD